MSSLRNSLQKPSGQVLLATLLFCFIFVTIFVGLYKAGTIYIMKERSRRATDLTALSAGAVYANGLQWVRYSNIVDMGLAAVDIGIIMVEISPLLFGLPGDLPAVVGAAIKADPKIREKVGQTIQKKLFGIGGPGLYPVLLVEMTRETAQANQLSDTPEGNIHLYNLESATLKDVLVPNMALRFRTAADLLPEPTKASYSLMHDGKERIYFSSEEVESAENPRQPNQMRVKNSNSEYGGRWVRKEKNGSDPGSEMGPLAKLGGAKVLNLLKDFLKQFTFDVTDEDDPPCHTVALMGTYEVKADGKMRTLRQISEVRVSTDGLAAWDITRPIDTYLQKVDLGAFPFVRKIPVLNGLLDRFGDLL